MHGLYHLQCTLSPICAVSSSWLSLLKSCALDYNVVMKIQFKHLIYTLVVAGVVAYLYNTQIASSADIKVPESATFEADTIWWDESYAFRREILSDNLGSVTFEINHANMVIEKKSLRDGSDLQIVEVQADKPYPIDTKISNPDSTTTKVNFNKTSSQKYYLYYAAQNPTTNLSTISSDLFSTTDVDLGPEESSIITALPIKYWYLDQNQNSNIELKLSSSIQLDPKAQAYLYNISTQELLAANIKSDIVSTPISTFGIGETSIALIIYNNAKVYRSNTISLTTSKPVYVAWSLDWEGVDPTEANLSKVEKIASDYNIPITHFFNPRVLMFSDITQYRREEIVDWVLRRQTENNDEIAMHMHMQHDMVEAAGIVPKDNEPSWNGDTRGYDTPSTVYTYEEYKKLLEWAKQKFSEYGLPVPKGYRAGGWFANEEILRAIEDAGFLYDSSGRKAFALGTVGFIQPWELSVTSQPYYPSYSDQNKTIENDKMKLLEIPNNGLDSYWSESTELINNFYANYTPTEVLNESKIVVYLSHPEWFEIDDPKLRELFTELQNYRNDLDRGPVVFVTIEQYLNQTGKIM